MMLENLTYFEPDSTNHYASAVAVDGPVYLDIAEDIAVFDGVQAPLVCPLPHNAFVTARQFPVVGPVGLVRKP